MQQREVSGGHRDLLEARDRAVIQFRHEVVCQEKTAWSRLALDRIPARDHRLRRHSCREQEQVGEIAQDVDLDAITRSELLTGDRDGRGDAIAPGGSQGWPAGEPEPG